MPLPLAILHTEQVEGYRTRQWVARPLDDSARPAVERAKNALEMRLAPARREVVIALLIRLAVQWPEVSKDPQAFGMRVADMAEDLADFSAEAIAAACVDWRRTENWYPKSADLRGKLLTAQAFDKMHLRRANILLGEDQPRSWETPDRTYDDCKVRDLKPLLDDLAQRKMASR